MLALSDDLLAHLNAGGTLVVPSRQRAAAVRLAHTAAQLAAGARSWNSPDVLAWSSWLERTLDTALACRPGAPRRLSGSEEWLAWRDAVRACGADAAVLFVDALIDTVRRAVTLLDDYALPLREAGSSESTLLLGARRRFREQCAQRHVLGTTCWQDCAAYLPPVTATRLSGFAALGPARRRWLGQLGVHVDEPGAAVPAGMPVQAFADPEQEAAAAAEWCAGMLARDRGARVLVVVPRLAEQAHRWQRALSERLEYRAILEPDAASGPALFAQEGGAPLRSFPLLAAALDLIALTSGEADFQTLSAVLRSPYFAALDAGARLDLDLWLREHNADTAAPAVLRGLIPVLQAASPAVALVLGDLLAALALHERGETEVASPAVWAARFAQALRACGWPGTGLGSAEQQVRARFDELLNELAALAALPRALTGAEACRLLEQLAARSAFEPASDDVAVTLSASLEDPIVGYDGIWIAGLTAQAWPEPARPDPLIPMALQLAAGVPGATAAGQRELALAALVRWERAGLRCQGSWPRTEGDLEHAPSPLLAPCAAGTAPPAASPFLLEAALAQAAPALEAWSDAIGPAWDRPGALRGGTRLLELQSLCPFRCFAELRLNAGPLTQPEPGIDARSRGRIVHRALELFWQTLRDSSALAQRGEAAARQLAQDCVADALQQLRARLPGLLSAPLLAAEGVRAERLMARLRDWERTREPFTIEALEWTVPLEIDGTTLQLRLDRADTLADGARLVIDYKSGAADPFDPRAERPERPQLPAYALASGTATRGVLALHLAPEALQLRGVADRPDRIAGLRTGAADPPDWSELLQHWHRALRLLIGEFVAGDARVAPQPGACAHCGLEMLCRIEHPATGGAA